MQFQVATPQKIVFGAGVAETLSSHALLLGRRLLFVTGRAQTRFAPQLAQLATSGLEVLHLCVSGEPTVSQLTHALQAADQFRPEFVIAMGGGSALDFGKALAALTGLGADPYEFLEVVGRGKKLPRRALPLIAVPTTSGPGSEATKNAVLTAEESGAKVSLRDDSMLATLALVDPCLTLSVPRDITAATGLDAITQCLEPLVSHQSNALLEPLAKEGFTRGFFALERVLEDGADLEGRTSLAYCSLGGGLALANGKLGAVHGFAAPLGGMFKAPHGAICARLLPHVVATNIAALRARAPGNSSLEKYEWIARALCSSPDARAEDSVAPLLALADVAGIPGLRSYGVERSDHARVVERAKKASSMAGNPIELSDDELHAILELAH